MNPKPIVVSNDMEKTSLHRPKATYLVNCLVGFLVVLEAFCYLPVSFALLLGNVNLTIIRVHPHAIPHRKPLGKEHAGSSSSNLVLAVVLLIVILIQAFFNAWQDFSISRVMASMKGMLPADVLVLRDSFRIKLPAKELVPGDLVTLAMGDKVPADIRLIEVSADLQFDRSVLTGEVSFFYLNRLWSIKFSIIYQSDAVSGRVAMTDDNFLEVAHFSNWWAVDSRTFPRPKMWLCKVLIASAAQVLVLSFKREIGRFCKCSFQLSNRSFEFTL